MDRNTVIGFTLLALLFFGYFYYTQQGQKTLEKQRIHVQDSLDKIKSRIDTAQLKAKNADSTNIAPVSTLPSGLVQDSSLTEGTFTIENNLAKYTFTNRGGQPKIVELKKFKTAGGQPLLLNDGKFNDISYEIRVVIKLCNRPTCYLLLNQ